MRLLKLSIEYLYIVFGLKGILEVSIVEYNLLGESIVINEPASMDDFNESLAQTGTPLNP